MPHGSIAEALTRAGPATPAPTSVTEHLDGAEVAGTPETRGERPRRPGRERPEDRRPVTPRPDGVELSCTRRSGGQWSGLGAGRQAGRAAPSRPPRRHRRPHAAAGGRKEASGWTGAEHQETPQPASRPQSIGGLLVAPALRQDVEDVAALIARL